jgi:hypothetical protein
MSKKQLEIERMAGKRVKGRRKISKKYNAKQMSTGLHFPTPNMLSLLPGPRKQFFCSIFSFFFSQPSLLETFASNIVKSISECTKILQSFFWKHFKKTKLGSWF